MSDTDYGVSLADILAARERIAGIARRTPLKPSEALSRRLEKQVWLKMETMQDTGSFKIRGAANKILSLDEYERKRGVVTASSGNHGKSVAYLARKLGLRAVICMTDLVPEAKVAAIRSLGAEVVIHGSDQDEATERAHELAGKDGLTFISAFDDPQVIAGQGTIGLEILEDCPEVETLVVQVSGGGLMSGVALAARAIKPDIRLIGVSTTAGAAMVESIRAGRIVGVEEKPSLADALPGPIPPDNRYTFAICRDLVDYILQVTEEQIAGAMVHALEHEKLVLEGGGAAGIALLLDRRAEAFGNTVAAICTGDNLAADKLVGLYRDVE